ncbi:MAG: cupin domain-containing protein [Mycobacteriales bacterium]
MDLKFDPDRHIRSVRHGRLVSLLDSERRVLRGVRGIVGVFEELDDGTEIGADRLIMESGSEFELHTHPGAHILYVLRSRGHIHVDGVDYEIGEGDTVLVPARYVHGVRTMRSVAAPLEILAFGVPHLPLASAERMTLVNPPRPAPADQGGGSWEVATDPAEVHQLLHDSDAHQARQSGSPVPQRQLETTVRHVRDGAVHLLRRDGVAVAMFTLSWSPAFDEDESIFPIAVRAAYLSRLSVAPAALASGSLDGLRCVRRAVELAAEAGADALRCEANPDLAGTRAMLDRLGFVQCGPVHADDRGRRWVYLHRPLVA